MHWRLVFAGCNLYKPPTAAILALNRYVGNLQPMPSVLPDFRLR
jgi:hypothetical protein